jgi:hypothetical protein
MKNSILVTLMFCVCIFIAQTTTGQMPDAITIEPENATVFDEITLTFDPAEACFQSGSLQGLPYIAMHSGVTVNGNTWQNVVAFNATGANGQSPILNANPDGTFSIVYTPYDFYGFNAGATVTQICAVFNNGNDWTQDGRDFQPGGTNCMDFFIPILPGIPQMPVIHSIVPETGEQGQSLNVNIFGINTHFQTSGTAAWLSLASDSLGFQSIYAVNDTLISAQLDLPENAVTGLWDLNVANPLDGLMTMNSAFEITDDTIPVYPFAITLSPANASAYDEVTLTLDAKLSCPEGDLFGADSVMMHSGVTIAGSGWQYVVNFDALGANGQAPKLIYNGDSTWSLVFIPLVFYGVPSGTYVEAINCVFNAGAWTAGEGKDYDDQGGCIDFNIPLAYATALGSRMNPGLRLYPNPAKDFLTIDYNQPVNSVIVLDSQGVEAANCQREYAASVTLDISGFSSGMYFVKVVGVEGETTVLKFVKE